MNKQSLYTERHANTDMGEVSNCEGRHYYRVYYYAMLPVEPGLPLCGPYDQDVECDGNTVSC